MSGHREPNQLAATVTHDYKCKQALKRHRVNQAKIDRCDRVRMVAQERSPGLPRLAASEARRSSGFVVKIMIDYVTRIN